MKHNRLIAVLVCILLVGLVCAAVTIFILRDAQPSPTSSPTSSPAPTMMCYSQLLPSERLDMGRFMCSDSGRYRFGFTENRDLAVWDTETEEKIWSIPTFSEEEKIWLTMQKDGNAVLKDGSSRALFATSTNGSPGAFLQIENDGTVRVLLENNVLAQVVLWNSHVNYFCDGAIKSLELQFLDKPSNMIPIDASTMHNKVMAGYQGWFNTECDGRGTNWRHYTNGPRPNVNDYVFEMWPDLREFNSTKDLCPTGFQFSDGTNAPLFSSHTDIIVEKHVKWMYDYEIDGVYVQRFVIFMKSQRCVRDRVLQNIRLRSEQYGRIFANMYDMSGANENTVYQHIKTDWIHLVDDLKITESDQYLHHNGKPVLSIWGFGFKTRVGDPERVLELIDWFQNKAPQKYQVTLMGGVPTWWRTLTRDSYTDPLWADVYRSFDIVSPWTVGRFENTTLADEHLRDLIIPDLAECTKYGIEYLPVIFPGSSFSNRKPHLEFNKIPRMGGDFMWRQIYNALEAGSKQLYVAMFDEIDEGTAIFKTAETSAQTPDEGNWLTLDVDGFDVPSDWYLRLMGNATKMLRESGSVPPTRPALPSMR
eukprot:scaffold22852_cov63-Attheya_sp.AAC.5